jgi:starch synthase
MFLRKLDRAEWGGTETALERLLEGLRENDVEAVVYSPEAAARRRPSEPPEIHRFHAFIPILGLTPQRRRQLVLPSAAISCRSIWSRCCGRNVTPPSSTRTPWGASAALPGWWPNLRHIPFVVSIHGGVMDLPRKIREEFNEPIRGGWDWGKLFGWLFGSRHLFRDADCIITCNGTEAALLGEEAIPANAFSSNPMACRWRFYQQNQRPAARDGVSANHRPADASVRGAD